MTKNRRITRARIGAVALACGALGLFSLTACSSSKSSATGGSTASAAPSSAPSWAAALGPGVTVDSPATATAGNDSPGAAMAGFVDAAFGDNFPAVCSYILPSSAAKCTSAVSRIAGNTSGQVPYDKNPGLGYIAVDGTKALVGITGTYCAPGHTPECFTNSDPAAIFSSGQSFTSLWNSALSQAGSTSNTYGLYPLIEINGKWYTDAPFGYVRRRLGNAKGSGAAG